MPVRTLVYAVAGHGLLERARAAGAQPRRIAAGGELRSGRLRLDVLWPPPELLSGPHAGEDPNLLALVIVARWGAFSMLLTADAEAESTPIDPGPVDVLKVAHHGSDDAGLDGLLERTLPRLAVISVGDDNTYGHPTAATLATLASHGVPHPAHRPRRLGRHRGARRIGGDPCRSLRAAPRADGSPTEYSEFPLVDPRGPRLIRRCSNEMISRLGQAMPHFLVGANVAGEGLRERLRSTTFALLRPGHGHRPGSRRHRLQPGLARLRRQPDSGHTDRSGWARPGSPRARSTGKLTAGSASASPRSAPAGKAQLVPGRSSGPHVTSQQQPPVTVSDGHAPRPGSVGEGWGRCPGASRSGAGAGSPGRPPAAGRPAAGRESPAPDPQPAKENSPGRDLAAGLKGRSPGPREWQGERPRKERKE